MSAAAEGRAEGLEAEPFEPEEELESELLAVVRSLRAHLEWQQSVGATGLPRDPDAKRRLQEEWAASAANAPAGTAAAGSPRTAAGVAARQSLERSQPAERMPSAERVPSGVDARPGPGPTAPRENDRASESRPTARVSLPVGPALPAPLDPALAGLDMAGLRARVAECTACALASTRTQTVFSRGQGTSGICFIGEGPGADEDAQGEPFVGAAGQLLDRMIAAMGLSRDEVYVCNIVKCRPPENRKPAVEEMAACSGYLRRQLELLQPEVIVALGGTAVTGLLGLTEGITRLRGTFRLYDGLIPVMPTFHPAYLLRQPEAKREVWNDLRQVLARVGRSVPERPR